MMVRALNRFSPSCRGNTGSRGTVPHQVGAEHEEADEVDVGQVAAAAELFARLGVGLRVAAAAGQRCQHDLLPLLSGRTPTSSRRVSVTSRERDGDNTLSSCIFHLSSGVTKEELSVGRKVLCFCVFDGFFWWDEC